MVAFSIQFIDFSLFETATMNLMVGGKLTSLFVTELISWRHLRNHLMSVFQFLVFHSKLNMDKKS